MKKEIWQTTNQQPWVEALAAGVITVKTRTSKPVVPVGATVLLHASKSRLWPDWKGLLWVEKELSDPSKWGRGVISAIAVVENVNFSDFILKDSEYKYWDVFEDNRTKGYNSVADFAVRFKNVRRLKVPVEVKGFQAPFARAKEETIKKVIKYNPELKPFLV